MKKANSRDTHEEVLEQMLGLYKVRALSYSYYGTRDNPVLFWSKKDQLVPEGAVFEVRLNYNKSFKVNVKCFMKLKKEY